MSINTCPTCGKTIDEDFDVEHYEECKAEQEETMTKQTLGRKRVLEIMKEEGMDIKNKLLVLDMNIMYIKSRQDLLKEQLKEMETK